jgi:hypoxanthine phosphoribosyltransferase
MSIIKVHDRFFEPYISADDITKRMAALATDIQTVYQQDLPVFVSVLNGSFVFTSDLLRQLPQACEIIFVKISSYEGTQSSGTVQTVMGFPEHIRNRPVLILEDIIDSGLSMKHLLEQVRKLEPTSVKIATLLFKREALRHPITPDFVGFEIENKFVVGYGLDYNELGRNLPHVYAEVSQFE